ncbi:ABC transporter substrate-binding protein [Roseomonas sp. BN140053]|uniref:ABC transporter substrate-binding protein n=1 Tax=Roseomonas sp. BN140053 TaxID=3391898 RepID=UPI0039EC0FC6
MNRRNLLALGAATATGAVLGPVRIARAADPLKVGLIVPLTGPFTSTGKQIEAAMRLYLQHNGVTVAGRTVELVVRDDGNVADATRRLAQELVVNEKVAVLAGFGLTPLALAAAPIATRAKVPMVVTAAATSSITEASPFVARTALAIPQAAVTMADWAFDNNLRKVVTIVSDYGPGLDTEKWFADRLKAKGGQIAEAMRVPLANPDFAPFLQRAKDAAPQAVFIFVPSGAGSVFMKQFAERGLDQSGIKLIGTGDVTDDDILNAMGDPALGCVTAHHYSASHDSALNKRFVEGMKQTANLRANFMGVSGYDGLALICKAVEKTGGDTDGTKLVEAMKGQSWESPRGPISIDPQTRDIVQNIYIRRVERVNGELFNTEFATYANVKDPAKAGGR